MLSFARGTPVRELVACPLQRWERVRTGRTQGFAADPDYWKGEVFAYGGSIQNLKDLKDTWVPRS